jgi:hypothetical protein
VAISEHDLFVAISAVHGIFVTFSAIFCLVVAISAAHGLLWLFWNTTSLWL